MRIKMNSRCGLMDGEVKERIKDGLRVIPKYLCI